MDERTVEPATVRVARALAGLTHEDGAPMRPHDVLMGAAPLPKQRHRTPNGRLIDPPGPIPRD